MIDEKKIEEAARETADLYEQDLPIMSYNEDTEVDGQHHFCQEFGAELFKDESAMPMPSRCWSLRPREAIDAS